MQEKKKYVRNVMDIAKNLARYALYFLAVVLTPLIATPIAKLFDWCVLDWSSPGQLRGFFTDLFTAILWLNELVVILIVEHFAKRSFEKKMGETGIRELQSDELSVEPLPQETEVEAEVAATEAETMFKGEEKTLLKKEKLSQRVNSWWKPKPMLPLRNVGILFLITAACILLISVQIDFQVKPFYDLGDKTTYSEIVNMLGFLVMNLFKCIWIVMIIQSALGIWQALMEYCNVAHVKFIKWIGTGAMVLLFGLYDVFTSANPFAWTYIIFYVAFTAIYYFQQRSNVKSYLLIFFLYIF